MRSPLVRLALLLLCLLLSFHLAMGEALCCAPAVQACDPHNSITVNTAASGGSMDDSLMTNTAPSALALEGFFAAAFHSEYGDTTRDSLIRWEIPLCLFVKGEPTPDDLNALDRLLSSLKANVPGLPDISFASAEEKANVIISFVPFEAMAESLTTYEANNWGFMNCFSDEKTIRYGMIAIASDVTGQKDRNHLILEEFVNMLGLTADLSYAPESIIYQPYTDTQALADMDYEMLTLLYGSFVNYGMSREEAKAALEKIFPDQ